MGQALRILTVESLPKDFTFLGSQFDHQKKCSQLPDLAYWPPELSLHVLSNLNATDLCLASCVWDELAKDDCLWHSLCYSQWGYLSCYFKPKPKNFSYHKLYLRLDEASVTFNADCHLGINYFIKYGLLHDDPQEIARFLHKAKPLDRTQVRYYLESRPEILDSLINLHNFDNLSLANALRKLFYIFETPDTANHYLHLMVEIFSKRFAQCNSNNWLFRNHTPETIYVLCFSLIMLSVDLSNPHIKNKMSKREFIRNVRGAIRVADDELYGHLYDDIYLRGHIAK